MTTQQKPTLYAPATWTLAELSNFSLAEFKQLVHNTPSMVATQRVTQLLLQKPRTDSNVAFAEEVKARVVRGDLLKPTRIETQVVPRGGTLTFAKDQVEVISLQGERQVAPAAVLPTFQAKPRAGLDVLAVAIVAVVKIKQGIVTMVPNPQQWQSAFGNSVSAIRVAGLTPFFREVKATIEADVVFTTTVGPTQQTLSGYQFADFIHGLLLRLSTPFYLYLHGVYVDKFLSAFERATVATPVTGGQPRYAMTPLRIIATTPEGNKVSVLKMDKACFIKVGDSKPEVKEAMSFTRSDIYLYQGGANIGMTVAKKDGRLITAMAVASAQMQLRGGVDGGLGTFTASLGIGNLLAPGTRRQTLLAAMAFSAKEHHPQGEISVYCTAGDLIPLAMTLRGKEFTFIMAYEEQRKCKLPKGLEVKLETTPSPNSIQVWFDDAPIGSSEEERQTAYDLFVKRVQGWDFLCWTAAWDPIFDPIPDEHAPDEPDLIIVGMMPARGSPDFKTFVMSEQMPIKVPGQDPIQLKFYTTAEAWNDAVIQSNVLHTSFLVRPHYVFSPLSNVLRRVIVEQGVMIVNDEGEWTYEAPREMHLDSVIMDQGMVNPEIDLNTADLSKADVIEYCILQTPEKLRTFGIARMGTSFVRELGRMPVPEVEQTMEPGYEVSEDINF